jgi:hypothetical protein
MGGGKQMTELENSAVTEQIVTEETPAETKEVLTKDSVLEMLKAREEEINKKWQSRFDKLVTEKNTVDTKAMTVEQRLAQIEAERQAERLSFTRERARNKAQIDENFERAIKLYGSDKEEEITAGAEAISNFIQEMKKSFEAEKAKAVQDALVQAGIQKKPITGSTTNTLTLAEFNKLAPKEQADYMAKGGKLQE